MSVDYARLFNYVITFCCHYYLNGNRQSICNGTETVVTEKP